MVTALAVGGEQQLQTAGVGPCGKAGQQRQAAPLEGDLVIGAGIDHYTGYGQRGSFPVIEGTLQAIVELFPLFSRVRMNRQWGGIVDVSPDACPIISMTPVRGLYINCGWGTGGFKATPGSGWVMAHTVAQDRPHPLNEAFSLDRFFNGHLIDEHGAAAVAH